MSCIDTDGVPFKAPVDALGTSGDQAAVELCLDELIRRALLHDLDPSNETKSPIMARSEFPNFRNTIQSERIKKTTRMNMKWRLAQQR